MTALKLTPDVNLDMRRCGSCNRWFATEQYMGWECGACAKDEIIRLNSVITKLMRSSAALRGALRRKSRRAKR